MMLVTSLPNSSPSTVASRLFCTGATHSTAPRALGLKDTSNFCIAQITIAFCAGVVGIPSSIGAKHFPDLVVRSGQKFVSVAVCFADSSSCS